MLAGLALAAMVASVALGLAMLAGLRRSSRRLPRLVPVHLVCAVATVVAWGVYVVEDDPRWLAWAVFGLLTVVNTFGDTLMVQGYRARATRAGRPAPTGFRLYAAAAREALTFTRPTASVHALLAPVAYFSVLLLTLGVGG